MIERLIDVDGCRLSLRETGAGSTAVVMLASSGGAHDQWDALVELLKETTTCVTYGRPGLAGSDPLPPDEAMKLRPASWATEQLHDLLRAADIAPPYILTGCSIGGWIVDQFTARWPGEVAGVVQVDPTFIRPIPRMELDKPFNDADGSGITFDWEMCGDELESAPPQPPRRAVVISRAFGTVPPDVVERAWKPLTMTEVDEGWREKQREWARRLDAVHVAADTGGHHVHKDQPDLVALVLRAVIDAAREDRDLVLDPDAVNEAGGTILTT